MSDSPVVSMPPSYFHRTHPRAADVTNEQSTMAQSSSPQRSITSSPRKKKARNAPRGTRCICGDKTCDEIIDQIRLLDQTDHRRRLNGYFRLPAKPKESTTRLSKTRELEKLSNGRRRERILQALPKYARHRTEDPNYKASTAMYIAAIHFHPKVLHLCKVDNGGNRRLPHSIPRSLGLHLTKETKCAFTRTDEATPGGDYFPIPNYTIQDAKDVVNELESNLMTSSFNDFAPTIVSPRTICTTKNPPKALIDTTIYTRDLPADQCFTAKQAKEWFFLTADDLKGLAHQRDKGMGSHMMKSGACKFYKCNHVRDLALRVWHSAENLTLKARTKNERAAKRAEKERLKRLEEDRLRREAMEDAQRKQVALAEAKKTAALDRKRKREQDAKDVESWGKLRAILGESQLPVEPAKVHKLVEDAMAWRQQCASKRKASRGSEDGE